jgi:TatD DNase family protein
MVPLFDTHAHLDHRRFDDDREIVIERAFAAGVDLMVNPGVDLESSQKAIHLAEKHTGIYAGVGFSPHDAKKARDGDYELLARLASHPRVVAWGEIGLDYHYDLSPRETQRESLRRQLGLAKDHNLPVIFHQREAEEDFFKIIGEVGLPRAGGIMHCFTSDRETLEKCLGLRLFISFSGIVTFKRSREEFEILLRATPWDRLLVETDSPYLAPGEHRGERCEPSMIGLTIVQIARAKGASIDKAAEILRANALRVFRMGVKSMEA